MRILQSTAFLTLLSTALLAGCAENSNPGDDAPLGSTAHLDGFAAVALADLPTFSAPLVIDDVRAGGEPVIAITQAGSILVSSHPGFTHYHTSSEDPTSSTDLLTAFGGQSYLWRSTDQGATWTHIGLPGMEEGPRSLELGVSDPEFTVMEDGAICHTDLESLVMSSTACSEDDGLTWLPGNPIASGAPTDRQWLASYGDEFYFTANYFIDHHIRASTDKGLTWEDRGDVPCSGDLIADPSDGHLIAGCGPGITVSEDAGRSWSEARPVPGHDAGGRSMAEPAIDSAGNVWVTWAEGETTLWAAGSPDEGLSWPWLFNLTAHVTFAAAVDEESPKFDGTGTYVWPWISAGSDGRFAVTWFGSYLTEDSSTQSGPWYVFSATVVDATSAVPSVAVSRLTPAPIHDGPICQSGTTCQATSVLGEPSGDRRLGDFFETTIGPDGYLYGVWSNTHESPNDVVSHVQFVRQTGGLRLIADDELGSFTPTQG